MNSRRQLAFDKRRNFFSQNVSYHEPHVALRCEREADRCRWIERVGEVLLERKFQRHRFLRLLLYIRQDKLAIMRRNGVAVCPEFFNPVSEDESERDRFRLSGRKAEWSSNRHNAKIGNSSRLGLYSAAHARVSSRIGERLGARPGGVEDGRVQRMAIRKNTQPKVTAGLRGIAHIEHLPD